MVGRGGDDRRDGACCSEHTVLKVVLSFFNCNFAYFVSLRVLF